MKFCKKCGKQLDPSMACSCSPGAVPQAPPPNTQYVPPRTQPPPAQAYTQPPPAQAYTPPTAQPYSPPPAQAYTPPPAQAYSSPTSQAYTPPRTQQLNAQFNSSKTSAQQFIETMKNKMGIGDPARNATDTYERGMKIIPDCISDNEGEIPVRQYNVAVLRNLFRFERAEGRIQVTNKRVIFRAVGRSIGGRTTHQQEFNIDEIAGIEATRGYRFGLFFLLLGIAAVLVGALIASSITVLTVPKTWTVNVRVPVQEEYLVNGETRTRQVMETQQRTEYQYFDFGPDVLGSSLKRLGFFGTAFGLIFGFGGLAPFFMIQRRFLLKLLPLGASLGGFAVMYARWNLFAFFLAISALVIIFGLFLYCMRPDLAIVIKNKGAIDQSPPVKIRRSRGFWAIFQDSGTGFSEVMPTPESEGAINEIGAIINDIQKLGDYGIQKWQK